MTLVRLVRIIGDFLSARRGNVMIMTALMLIPMTLVAGGGVDLARFEQIRSRLQGALDRGVVAAASLSQTMTAQETVESYLKTVAPGSQIALTVTEDRQLNARKVTATASLQYEPAFLHLAGLSSIEVPAASTAEERRPNIELSVILDISGSMYDNGGMAQLKPAARSFIDTILKPEMQPVTSVSIVPFAGQVSPGAKVFDYLAGIPADPDPENASEKKRWHGHSSCFELLDADFNGGIPDFVALGQVPHFTYYNYNVKGKKPWWCPTDDASIAYLSNDPVYLKSRIDALEPFDGTGTAYAVKWGELLLDPGMRSAVAHISQAGLAPVPSAFVGRPADFGRVEDTNTLKFMVVMTDGQIGFQPRPKDPATTAVTDKNISCKDCSREIFKGQVSGQYKRMCDYAKLKGITIFTIAFKISDNNVAKGLAECASQPSYAFRVDGLAINDAFRSIASAIQGVKLTG